MREIKHQAVLPYSAKQMFDLVNDIAAYPEFLPWCTDSELHFADEDEIQASITVSGGGVSKSFTTHNRLQTDKMIEIRLVDGPFRHLEGFWRFEDLDNGQSRVHLDLAFEFAGGMMDMLFGPFFYQVASSFVEAFSKRAEHIYGK